VVDALLGTGATGEPRGEVRDAIKWINGAAARVVSADLPSGIDPDTGSVPGIAVWADVTVTFGLPKPGLLLHPGAECVGRLVVDPIGVEWCKLPFRAIAASYEAADASMAIPPRPSHAHKGTFGSVLVVGGSEGMPGAPALAAAGALRAGAGLVTVALPRCASAARLPCEAMRVLLPDRDGFLVPDDLSALSATLDRATVVCLGPGLGTAQTARELALALMATCLKPLVVDADALNALAGRPEAVTGRSAPTVLTPHPGECARLLGVDTDTVQADRLAAARRSAHDYGAVVILKGAGTVIAAPAADPDAERPAAIISAGNPGMATGGSGDVLTGVVAALLAQGLEPFDAACLAAFVHGRAGDIARERLGMHGMIGGDIAAHLPLALKELAQ
jgi:NAD(P)H-hydrate epimerase